MLTSSPAAPVLLFRPTINLLPEPVTRRPLPEWSVRAADGCGGRVGRWPAAPSPMSDAHVCPYPRRGTPSSCAAPCGAAGQQQQRPAVAYNNGGAVATMDVDAAAYSLDYERIGSTVAQLECSGWYYGQLSWQQASDVLKGRPVGTFLVRDSSDPMYLFALSVQTERGPTSVRIHYADGQFKLDAEELLVGNMPLFDCVVKLVDYYVCLSRTDKARAHVWLDVSGRRDRPIRLSEPLLRRVPPLQHLCRLAVNGRVPPHELERLNLPTALVAYIRDYPHQR